MVISALSQDIMAIKAPTKMKIIKDFKLNDKDSGSSPVQIALLTERINSLTAHLKTHAKDFHSRRGLLHLVNQRRKLLMYLQKTNEKLYKEVVKKLNLKG